MDFYIILAILNYVFSPDLGLDSEILDNQKKIQLFDMCKFNLDTKWTLVNRSTRDGFGANIFHDKCGHISKSLTIIKTTYGHILGGYTEQTWGVYFFGFDSSYKPENVCDPNAFIFGFMNQTKPVFLKVVNENNAISRSPSYGPTFGKAAI